jgi:heterodisulfide reductase subunit A-like polyferredoxin
MARSATSLHRLPRLFNEFLASKDFMTIVDNYHQLECIADANNTPLKQLLVKNNFKAQRIYECLDSKQSNTEQFHEHAHHCQPQQRQNQSSTAAATHANSPLAALIVGAGPAGLRVAIESTFYGVTCIVIERRVSFSRNNCM